VRQAGFRIALDDLGAGSPGSPASPARARVVKLDMSLIRDVHKHPTKARLIRSMAVLCREQGVSMVAEGIETVEERDTVVALGLRSPAGYLFARPARGFPPAASSSVVAGRHDLVGRRHRRDGPRLDLGDLVLRAEEDVVAAGSVVEEDATCDSGCTPMSNA